MNIYEGIDAEGYDVKVMAKNYAEAVSVCGGDGCSITFVESIPQMKFVIDD